MSVWTLTDPSLAFEMRPTSGFDGWPLSGARIEAMCAVIIPRICARFVRSVTMLVGELSQ